MQNIDKTVLIGLAALMPVSLALASTSEAGDMPLTHYSGPIAYLSGGDAPAQAAAMDAAAARYPLELDFLWGRGAKETALPAVDWSIQSASGREMLDAPASGPVVLATLPNGRYTVTAHYDGDTLSRPVHVRQGIHDDVVLEWPR